ncbi:hypothetical protein PQX77_012739 [Marasmius sp. AFHP31]|nr:hypothetical protein PQX77_012739 [Marasmius sp. AFHP31]
MCNPFSLKIEGKMSWRWIVDMSTTKSDEGLAKSKPRRDAPTQDRRRRWLCADANDSFSDITVSGQTTPSSRKRQRWSRTAEPQLGGQKKLAEHSNQQHKGDRGGDELTLELNTNAFGFITVRDTLEKNLSSLGKVKKYDDERYDEEDQLGGGQLADE